MALPQILDNFQITLSVTLLHGKRCHVKDLIKKPHWVKGFLPHQLNRICFQSYAHLALIVYRPIESAESPLPSLYR
jgi:hypothetical protein